MFNRYKKENSVIVSTDYCTGCGLCTQKCRRQAMGLITLRNKTYAMLIHQENCTGCGKCLEACPTDAIELIETSYA